MKPKGSTPIRASGQRSILSTFNHQYAQPCSTNHSDGSGVLSNKNKRGSNLSFTDFLNRKLHTTSVLPFDKDDKTFSVVKNETSPLAANCNPRTKSILRGEQYDCEGPRDEKGHVIEDSVFKLFNDSGGNKKRSSECLNDPSQSEGASKQHSQNHLLVLGDDPKPKRRSLGRNTCSNKKQRPLYNHYENGTGFWEPEREGIDSAEVGSTEMWEGMGSTTTLGGLDELSTFDHL
ncbi:uncharacterized protein LOC110689226 isoform X2 [Chenopodium quinoa]|uniref:uncharacterized protein LOC110689226 isoform X2 n=1 Tax=Chenopodium quinoa TaxID=63459 RepID=UPI000B7780BD|nr:uncharacterized protein LOC110689226 isoform X2 [Chenopodium quinoa]